MRPVDTFIICATPRSGSTLLCDLLRRTGAAGRPASYFRRQSIPGYASRLNVENCDDMGGEAFFRAYIDAVMIAARSGCTVSGIRIMWESLGELNSRLDVLFPGLANDAARLEAVFGKIAYVHLSRGDKLGQAISLAKASQTGLWHVAPDGSELERTLPPQPAEYSRELLQRNMRQLAADDAAWRSWFDAHGITPLSLTYEELSRDPRAVLARMLAAIGQDPAIASKMEPGTARMADEESRAWAQRFRAETGAVAEQAAGLPAKNDQPR